MDSAGSSLFSSVARLETVKYTIVASATTLFFDYFQTLDLEVKYIWTSKLNFGKALFLYARYSAFVDVPLVLYSTLAPVPYKLCHNIDVVTSLSTVFGIAAAELIMILRTRALWGNSRKIFAILLCVFTIGYISAVIITAFFLRSLKYGEPPLPTLGGCYPTKGNSHIVFANYTILMVIELIIMVLTLWIGVKRFRHFQSALVITLYRDGVFYFVYIFLISAGNIAVLIAGPLEYVDLLNTFQRVMHSVLSTRIMLHVRETAASDYPLIHTLPHESNDWE